MSGRILRPELPNFPLKKRMTLTSKIIRLEKNLGVECGRKSTATKASINIKVPIRLLI